MLWRAQAPLTLTPVSLAVLSLLLLSTGYYLAPACPSAPPALILTPPALQPSPPALIPAPPALTPAPAPLDLTPAPPALIPSPPALTPAVPSPAPRARQCYLQVRLYEGSFASFHSTLLPSALAFLDFINVHLVLLLDAEKASHHEFGDAVLATLRAVAPPTPRGGVHVVYVPDLDWSIYAATPWRDGGNQKKGYFRQAYDTYWLDQYVLQLPGGAQDDDLTGLMDVETFYGVFEPRALLSPTGRIMVSAFNGTIYKFALWEGDAKFLRQPTPWAVMDTDVFPQTHRVDTYRLAREHLAAAWGVRTFEDAWRKCWAPSFDDTPQGQQSPSSPANVLANYAILHRPELYVAHAPTLGTGPPVTYMINYGPRANHAFLRIGCCRAFGGGPPGSNLSSSQLQLRAALRCPESAQSDFLRAFCPCVAPCPPPPTPYPSPH